MLDPADEAKLSTLAKTLWLSYFSFVAAMPAYAVVVFIVTRGNTPRPLPFPILPLFLMISLIAAAAKFWVQSRFFANEESYRNSPGIDAIIERYTRYFYIMLALSEVPVLLGLIVAFLAMRMGEWWLFLGISILLFATSAPRPGMLRRIAEDHAARHPVT
ncbi:MAG: hypothetical protein C4520_00615 [Candidatus Abyssobacteria bacterium SURF_5]|uniref:Uncharacterized protein n=1 Tax=Abyssobacteria bacterium (strain SURF_5) TaxID=2093360 RepID=A0A3A4P7D9_ABYX5|nr:MAG: hypothetical protein C4520_00615 [Candidatus Abyssubacteria bacterium SURF_5]